MNIARFLRNDRVQWGIIEGEEVRALQGSVFGSPSPGRALGSLSEVRLLAPIDTRANKVVAAAANYGEPDGRDGPGIFLKQPGTVVAHNEPIVYPRSCRSVIHEAELGIVIGRSARHVSASDALDYVFGYTCVNDVSASEMTTSDVGRGTSMRVKHFDTFCPIGPWITTGLDGDNLRIQCRVNGDTHVDGSTGDMVWGVARTRELDVRSDDAESRRHHSRRVPGSGRDKRRRQRGGGTGGHRHTQKPGGSRLLAQTPSNCPRDDGNQDARR